MTKDFSQPENPYENTLNHAMSLWFTPEIERRQAAGLIPKPFPFMAAQVIFHPGGTRPEIRLNEEVKAVIDVKYKDGVAINKGDAVLAEHVERFNSMVLPETEDPDCGHFTTIQLRGVWYLCFDFVYNKGRARALLSIGREFLSAASGALNRGHMHAFIDTLFSAAEIAANVLLFVVSPEKNTPYPSHGAIHSHLNRYAKLGNIDQNRRDSFNKLANLRSKARYGKIKVHLPNSEANKLLRDTEDLIDQAAVLVSRRSK
jgi:uncharacterized protein (UPF0332 family)